MIKFNTTSVQSPLNHHATFSQKKHNGVFCDVYTLDPKKLSEDACHIFYPYTQENYKKELLAAQAVEHIFFNPSNEILNNQFQANIIDTAYSHKFVHFSFPKDEEEHYKEVLQAFDLIVSKKEYSTSNASKTVRLNVPSSNNVWHISDTLKRDSKAIDETCNLVRAVGNELAENLYKNNRETSF
ncbi:MAG: hypothetical protein V4489_06970 [Chlamydiota bacterium]